MVKKLIISIAEWLIKSLVGDGNKFMPSPECYLCPLPPTYYLLVKGCRPEEPVTLQTKYIQPKHSTHLYITHL